MTLQFTTLDALQILTILRLLLVCARSLKEKKPLKEVYLTTKRLIGRELSRVDWHFLLDRVEPDLGWGIFKKKCLLLCDKHIPKIKIKESFQPPWFDSDVFRLNKKKKTF